VPNVCSIEKVPPDGTVGKHPFEEGLDAERRFVIG